MPETHIYSFSLTAAEDKRLKEPGIAYKSSAAGLSLTPWAERASGVTGGRREATITRDRAMPGPQSAPPGRGARCKALGLQNGARSRPQMPPCLREGGAMP